MKRQGLNLSHNVMGEVELFCLYYESKFSKNKKFFIIDTVPQLKNG